MRMKRPVRLSVTTRQGKIESEAPVDELGIGRYCNSGGPMEFQKDYKEQKAGNSGSSTDNKAQKCQLRLVIA